MLFENAAWIEAAMYFHVPMRMAAESTVVIATLGPLGRRGLWAGLGQGYWLRSILVLSVVIGSLASSAQPTFMKIFRATGTSQADLNEQTSGNLRVGMARGAGSSMFDPEGVVLQTKVYVHDTFLNVASIRRYADNEYVFTGGYRKDTCLVTGSLKIYPVVGRMDSLGNVLQANYYALNAPECATIAGTCEVLGDGNVISYGTVEYSMFAMKTNTTGVPLWAKSFSEKAAFQFIKELPNGDLLAGINMANSGAVVARLDADGNFIWCKSYIRPSGMVHDGVVLSDSSFIITGFTDSIAGEGGLFFPPPPPFHPKLFMMKLDGDGMVQWCKGYDSEYNWVVGNGSQITSTRDGNFAILANIRTQNDARPFLFKVDQSGDTLWTRSNGRVNYQYETRKLIEYSDGSLIYNGRIWGNHPDGQVNWAYLFKADSTGHLPCYERFYPITVEDLFPVDSNFVLSSVDGATAYPATVQDTVYLPIVLYDGCTFSTSVNPLKQARKFTIRPNPTTGRFTIEFPDPLQASSYYSVYDSMGRLLYQRPLPTGATLEDVDLSRFGRGTYTIRFTSPSGVQHERVVVE